MNSERTADPTMEGLMNSILSILPQHVQSAVQHSLADARTPAFSACGMVGITSFYLGDEDHRREFLWQYYAQGSSVSFAAVNHVWNSLTGDRAHHCALIGELSGTGGTGKAAVLATLQQFLEECLAFNADLPRLSDYSDIETWHCACVKHWAEDAAHAWAQCTRYSAFLDGRLPQSVTIGQSIKPFRPLGKR